MMIATGFAAIWPFSSAKEAADYMGHPPAGKAKRLVHHPLITTKSGLEGMTVADIRSRLARARAATVARAGGTPLHPHPRTPDAASSLRPPTASSVMRLVADVARLEGELAAARAQVAALEATADVDPLTEIFNRRGFKRELARAVAYVKRYETPAALVYVDLDGFKPVNDAHGHAAGDAMLKAVAATLRRHVRASDTVARVGGDEFVLLLWHLGAADAARKAAATEDLIAATEIAWNGARLSVGASAGFTELTPRDDAGDVLARADQAMYARKAERKRGR
jgi:diguanylate cyclase (GGDEF)-like protein